jgi:hypothetical protein
MIRGDVFFAPEVYWDGMYRSVCFDDMKGAESVADAVCLAAGFNGGARVVKEAGKTFGRDAIPVATPSLPPLSFYHCGINTAFLFVNKSFVNVPPESLFPAA